MRRRVIDIHASIRFGEPQVALARQLLLWVLLPQMVLWIAGGIGSYKFAAGYANQAVDDSLLQASRSLARQLKPIGNGLLIDFPRAAQDVLEVDPDDRQLSAIKAQLKAILDSGRVPAAEEWRLIVYTNCPSAGKYGYHGIDNSDLTALLKLATKS